MTLNLSLDSNKMPLMNGFTGPNNGVNGRSYIFKRDISLPKDLSASLKKNLVSFSQLSDLQQYINDFVASYLHPYITSQLNSNNELENKLPMIKVLLSTMSETKLCDEKKIIKMALKAYFKCAALGLYVNQKIKHKTVEPTSRRFNILLRALKEAVPKDFEESISTQKLTKYAEKALLAVNEERSRLNSQAKTFFRLDNSADKPAKFTQLQQPNVLFLDSESQIISLEKKVLDSLTFQLDPSLEILENEFKTLDKNLKNYSSQSALNVRSQACRLIIELLNHPILKGNHYEDSLKNIFSNIAKLYIEFLNEKTSVSNFSNYIELTVNLFNYLQRLENLRTYLRKLNLLEAHELISDIETNHWGKFENVNTLISDESIQNVIARTSSKFNVLTQICKLIIEKEALTSKTTTSLLESCVLNISKFTDLEIKKQFQPILGDF